MATLAIVCREQFGYHTDLWQYATHLSKDMEVKVFCIDAGLEKLAVPSVNVTYVKPRKQGRLFDLFSLLMTVIRNKREIDVLFLKYFLGSSLFLFFFPRKQVIFDVRTFSVDHSAFKRAVLDLLLRLEVRLGKNITAVSSSLAKRLWNKNVTVVGLGCDYPRNNFQARKIEGKQIIQLLYVGTLHNRDIATLIHGLQKVRENLGFLPFQLKIAGSGYGTEEAELETMAIALGVSASVELLGYQRGEALVELFLSSDLGVVQVPDTPYYASQPSTKLFEYWSYGLPVVASDYPMNREFVTPGTGLLYAANSSGFANALMKIHTMGFDFDFHQISDKARLYSWNSIIRRQLLPAIEGILRS